jgi:hypothetical protein
LQNDTNGQRDIFVHDRQTGQTQRVSVASGGSQANYSSRDARISGDGYCVAFGSHATTLVEADTDTNQDIYVHQP